MLPRPLLASILLWSLRVMTLLDPKTTLWPNMGRTLLTCRATNMTARLGSALVSLLTAPNKNLCFVKLRQMSGLLRTTSLGPATRVWVTSIPIRLLEDTVIIGSLTKRLVPRDPTTFVVPLLLLGAGLSKRLTALLGLESITLCLP